MKWFKLLQIYVVLDANKSDHYEGSQQKPHPCRFRGGWSMGSRETISRVILREIWWRPGYLFWFAEPSKEWSWYWRWKGDLIYYCERKGEKRHLTGFKNSLFTCWILQVTGCFLSTSGGEENQGGRSEVSFSWITVLVRNLLNYNGNFLTPLVFLPRKPRYCWMPLTPVSSADPMHIWNCGLALCPELHCQPGMTQFPMEFVASCPLTSASKCSSRNHVTSDEAWDGKSRGSLLGPNVEHVGLTAGKIIYLYLQVCYPATCLSLYISSGADLEKFLTTPGWTAYGIFCLYVVSRIFWDVFKVRWVGTLSNLF